MMSALNHENSSPSSSIDGSVNGRGLRHRKMSLQEAVRLAADLVSGQQQLKPSVEQVCGLLPMVTPARVRAELKARAAANGNGPSEEVRRFIEAWTGLSQVDREQALQIVGVAEVWDALASIVS